uniref:Uncharacterized protein n=1 Tax=Saccharum hybrid cultivar R570 TaxID=131158 RepID=A0A059Q334_9POAL|nr:hypothetical protein SHCRBa_165_I15_F_470 [Saccharum hybrid cultivar R570]
MRGSADAVAVARDVASSSPSKPASALDMMRYPRPSSDGLPLPNGIGSGGSGTTKKPAAPTATPAPRSSKDDVAPPPVATDSSRLAAFLATTSLEPKPRPRAPQTQAQPQPPEQAAPTSAPTTAAVAVVTKSPARDHGHGNGNGNGQHPSSDHSDPASPSSTGAGELLLQWGQNKRMRCRRDSASASPQRRQAGGGKIQRRSSSPLPAADKLMPPPSAAPYTRASNLRSASPLPPRSGSGSSGGASDAHHARPHPFRYARRRYSLLFL